MSQQNNYYTSKQLAEEYDSIMMKVLLERYMQTEDKCLEQEELNCASDPTIQLTPERRKQFAKQLDESLRKSRQKKFLCSFRKNLSHVAVFFFVVLISCSVIMMSVEAVRLNVFNWIIEMQDKYISIEPTSGMDDLDETGHYLPMYIPEGYTLSGVDNKEIRITTYQNIDQQLIEFYEIPVDAVYNLDSEDAQLLEHTIVDGCEAIYISKDGLNTYFWRTNNKQLMLISQESREIMDKIINSIEVKD